MDDTAYTPDEVDAEDEMDYCEIHGPVMIVNREEQSDWSFDAIHYCILYYWSCGCTYQGNCFKESF